MIIIFAAKYISILQSSIPVTSIPLSPILIDLQPPTNLCDRTQLFL